MTPNRRSTQVTLGAAPSATRVRRYIAARFVALTLEDNST